MFASMIKKIVLTAHEDMQQTIISGGIKVKRFGSE